MNQFASGRPNKPIQCVQSGNITMSPTFNWICSEPITWGKLECRLDLQYVDNAFKLFICNVNGDIISSWDLSADKILQMFEDAKDYDLSHDELELTGMLYPRNQKGELGQDGESGFDVGWTGGVPG